MTAETGVKWVLRFISLTTIPAFVGAVMPQRWLASVLNWIEPGFPVGLFGSYIARCLMGVYAFMGIQAAMSIGLVHRTLRWCLRRLTSAATAVQAGLELVPGA